MSLKLFFFKKRSNYFRQLWRKSPFYRLTLRRGEIPYSLAVVPTDPWPGDLHAGQLLIEGKITFAHHITPITDLWMPKDIASLALENLHTFTWLRDLRTQGDNSARRLARQLITNWIERHQDWKVYPWKPSLTGHRVANWIALYDFFCASADDSFRTLFFKNLARQVRHLSHAWQDEPTPLERFFALKGMIYGAVTFPQEQFQLSSLLGHLEQQVQEQLLPDGGHKSRCPQTHLLVLRDLIDIRAILRLIHYDIPPFLVTSISQMAPIVRLFRHGDGKLATFGQEIYVSSAVIDMVLSLADVRGRPPEHAPASKFERCSAKNSLILLNVGSKIESSQPALWEEGTGLLNFEWSLGRNRLITQGDLILQTQEGILLSSPKIEEILPIQSHRTSQEGHVLLEATYNPTHKTPFFHKRQVYLQGHHQSLRGEDQIQTPQEAVYGVRFILNKDLEASFVSHRRGVVIQNIAQGRSDRLQEECSWHFLASGMEEILCESYSNHQVILLVGNTKASQSHTLKWAFFQS